MLLSDARTPPLRATKVFVVDAFAARPFTGNPAAVCLTDKPMDEDWMQSLAREMNLSETAFVRSRSDGFELRWFTPVREVDLCGHATLASAHVLWQRGLKGRHIDFHTRSGVLSVYRNSHEIVMRFPAERAVEADCPDGLCEALGVDPMWIGRNRLDYLVEVADAKTVNELKPDFASLAGIPTRGLIVTARGGSHAEFDFVSRFFAPAYGVDEDPVTGSAHCCLGPYWSERLGRSELWGFQMSPRGGTVHVTVGQDHVLLGGTAVTITAGASIS
ncbi:MULTISPECIES: PhzF family phenazine biosynthesis protein [unclassified Streptomyces]|uniref:PhzF family phenazine biosynthesis protein n=1 Tax=unclassified Streptomyces TaxID=2593676 RepID=UPI0037F18A1C